MTWRPLQINPKYRPLYLTKKPITLITGGRGSAKSFNVALFAKRLTYEVGHVILSCRYTMTSAEKSVIPEFKKKIDLEGDNDFFKITEKEVINKKTQSKVYFGGIKTSSGNQLGVLKGIEGLSTFIMDEGEEWTSEDAFETLNLSIRTINADNRTIIIMNPASINHFIFKKFVEPSYKEVDFDGVPVQISTMPNVEHIHITYLDNLEYLSGKFLGDVNELKQNHPNKYKYKIIGRWNDFSDENALFNWRKVRDMFSNFIPPSTKSYISCDAARYGRDLCVIMVWRGWEVVHTSIITKSDVNDIVKELEVLRLKFQIQKSNVIVDADGVGAATVKTGGYLPYHGGAKPINTDKRFTDNYKNLNMQVAFYLAEKIVNPGLIKLNITSGTVKIDGIYETRIKLNNKLSNVVDLICEDFQAIRYAEVDGEGKTTTNSKAEQMEILGRSPDFIDCIKMRVTFDLQRPKAYLS